MAEQTIVLQDHEINRLIFLLKKAILSENQFITDIKSDVDLMRKLESRR